MKSFKNSAPDADRLEAMREGGRILSIVRAHVVERVRPGVSFEELEAVAQEWLNNLGAKPSFPTVDGYKWATCITKNEGCCHGVPQGKRVQNGDIITIDVGALYKGYHTDTSITVPVGAVRSQILSFLEIGKRSVESAIAQAVPGNTVFDISAAMQKVVEEAGYRSIYQLTGHGIGTKLHMEPNIPCYADERSKKHLLTEGQTLAIEIMYAMGSPKLVLGSDGWTYETQDKSLTAMFEQTVIVREGGAEVLTA